MRRAIIMLLIIAAAICGWQYARHGRFAADTAIPNDAIFVSTEVQHEAKSDGEPAAARPDAR